MKKVLIFLYSVIVAGVSFSQVSFSNKFNSAIQLDSILIEDINLFSQEELSIMSKVNCPVFHKSLKLNVIEKDIYEETSDINHDKLKEWLWNHPSYFIFQESFFQSFPLQLQQDYLSTERLVVYPGPMLTYKDVELIP